MALSRTNPEEYDNVKFLGFKTHALQEGITNEGISYQAEVINFLTKATYEQFSRK